METIPPSKFELALTGANAPSDIITYKDPVYGERVFIRNGDKYEDKTKPPIQPIRTHSDRAYTMSDTASFVAAVTKYGEAAKGIIFYNGHHGQNDTTVTMFFDQDSRAEKITLPLATSLEFRAFLNGKEKAFSQKDFIKTLDTYPECVIPESGLPMFRGMVEKLQLSTKIDFEGSVDPDNLTFIYQERTGSPQSGRLPKQITLRLPFYEGSKNNIEIVVDLEVTTPKSENEKPTFKLVNVKHERTEREALKAEIGTLQASLPGWLFVCGEY